MPVPGVNTTVRESPPPRSAPTDTGVWIVAGLTDKGLEVATSVYSINDFVEKFGGRQTYSVLYDALETFFREGGYKAIINRVLGPAKATASANLFDASGSTSPGDVSLSVTAKSAGAWANALNIEVVNDGTNFVVIISHDDDGELERSGDLADRDAAVAWAQFSSDLVTLALGASAEDPRTQGPTGLTGGADDRASVTDAHWETALSRCTRSFGPGQVSFPGRTTTQAHTDLLEHADANNRVAVLDTPDTTNKSTLKAAGLAYRSLEGAKAGGLFGPWVTIPGIMAGTTRDAPYSAVQAGLNARSDSAGNSANIAAAGENGQSRFALDVKATFSDADREELNAAGVNLAIIKYDGVRSYGNRTLVDPETDRLLLQFSNARFFMEVVAEAEEIAEKYVHDQIDGRRHKIAEFGGELTGFLLPYFDKGALFGDTPDEAFNVDVGPTVNTVETIGEGQLRAVLALRASPSAEAVYLDIVKIATTEAVA